GVNRRGADLWAHAISNCPADCFAVGAAFDVGRHAHLGRLGLVVSGSGRTRGRQPRGRILRRSITKIPTDRECLRRYSLHRHPWPGDRSTVSLHGLTAVQMDMSDPEI